MHCSFRSPRDRHGAVSVEFALTAPILFILFMGAVEFSRANMLLHTTALAATEAARAGIIAGADSADVEQRARDELAAIGISNADVAVEPAVITDETDMITVGVGVPIDSSNGYFMPRFFLGDQFVKVITMNREAKLTRGNSAEAHARNNDMRNRIRQNHGNGGTSSGS